MSNEIQETLALAINNGSLVAGVPIQTILINQTNQQVIAQTISQGTAEADVDLSALTALGLIYIRNLDPTNFVEYGPKSGGSMIALGKLKPGEAALLRLMTGITLRMKADTATCKVFIQAVAD